MLLRKCIDFFENNAIIVFFVKKVIYSNKFTLEVCLNLHAQLRFSFLTKRELYIQKISI